MKITKTTDDNTTTYFYDGIKKYEYFKDSVGYEWWKEYKDDKEIHYKDSNGFEYWREFKDGKEVHFKNNEGKECWKEYKDDKEIHYKDSNGKEWWSDDHPKNPKNKEIAEEDVKPFEFCKK